jgi:ABC-type nitrate/sulfonate/bicarbonate transport system permease component
VETAAAPRRIRPSLIAQWLLLVAVLAVWQVVAGMVPPQLLPAPVTVWHAFGRILGDAQVRSDVAITTAEVMLAMAVAIPVGMGLGMAIATGAAGDVLAPLANVALGIPQSIFLPIVLLIFGGTFLEKVVFGFSHAIFIIIVDTVAATRSVPPDLLRLARLYGTRRGQLYRKIYLPCMLPVLVQGVRLGLIFCVTGVVLAEMYVSTAGIGRELILWGSSFLLPELMAGILLVGLVTILVNWGLRSAEHRAGRWRWS